MDQLSEFDQRMIEGDDPVIILVEEVHRDPTNTRILLRVCPMSVKSLRAPAAPYTAILLCDRILLNRHVILQYNVSKPYIHWKGMLLSRHRGRSCAAVGNLRNFAAS